MKKTKEQNTNKGITLIALVITIIVMLILVGVTISMAVNGGLFDYAGKAAGDTNNALKAEQQLADGGIKVGDEWYDSIDDYLEGKGWKTVYEGEATNDENYEMFLPLVFEQGYKYRMTVESLEEGGYSGIVETLPIKKEVLEEGIIFYNLFVISEEKEAKTWINSYEYFDIMTDYTEDSETLFWAASVESESMSCIAQEGVYGHYKITKIEKSLNVKNEFCLFDGYLDMSGHDDANPVELQEITFDLTKTYEILYSLGGVLYTEQTSLYSTTLGDICLWVGESTDNYHIICYENKVYAKDDLASNIIIYGIYEMKG